MPFQDPGTFARECAASLRVGTVLNRSLDDAKSAPFVSKGGLLRPWIKPIPRAPKKPQPASGIVHLWEGGVITTLEIKEEIQTLLASGHTLVEILDSKRAERPDDPNWWPSLMEVLVWGEFDQAFAKMLDAWNHAHQLEILEAITFNVMNPSISGLDDKTLKIQADYAAKVLHRIVNRGMADRIEVNQTNLNLNQVAQKMTDDALEARLSELSQNPKVRAMLVKHQTIGLKEINEEQATKPAELLDPSPLRPGETIEGLDIPDLDGEVL